MAPSALALAQPATSPVEDHSWTFSARLSRFHTDNFFLISPNTRGDSIDSLSLGLLYDHSGERLAYSGYGRVSANYYETFNQYNRLQYGGGLGLSYRLSPTARFTASEVASSGFYSPLLYQLSTFLPQVRLNAFRSAVGAVWQPGQSTTLTADGSFAYVNYSSDLSTLDRALIPQDALALVGALPLDEAGSGLEPLPTPLDASLVALSALSAEGVRQRQLNLTTYRTGLQAEQGLTRRLSGAVQFGYRGLDYGAAGLVSGGQLDSGASLRLAFGPETTTSLRYTYMQNRAQVPTAITQTALLVVEHHVTPRLDFDASFGIGVSDLAGVAVPSGTSWLGGAGVAGRFRRTRFDLRYGRSMFQAFGFGRNYLTDYGSAFVEQILTKRLTGRADVLYRQSQDVFVRDFHFVSQIYRASASYRVQRRTVVSAFYGYRIVELNEAPVIKSPAWGVSLTYARRFR